MKSSLKRYIFGILVLISFLFIPSGVSALDLKLTYSKEFNKCIRYAINLPSYDNNGNIDGYLYIYDGGIMKIDLNNKIVYEDKEYDARDNVSVEMIDSSNSDGYIVKGDNDLLITAVNDDGDILFTKQFGGNGFENGAMSINSYDSNGELDGYLILIGTLSSDLGIEPGYGMVKFDLKGNVIWIKNIGDYSLEGLFYYDGKKTFVFTVNDSRKLVKMDPLFGDVSFERDTGFNIRSFRYSYSKDGKIDGVVVVGYDHGYGTLVKYDLDGNEIFRVRYDNDDVESMYYDVISSYLPNEESYDGYIVTAVTSDNKTLLIKYDLNGNKVFEKLYSNDNSIGFMLANNYDSTGRKNGYLLYENSLRFASREIDSADLYDTYGMEICSYHIAKYTYDMFPVVKKEDDGGSITVKSDAYPGELVKVKVVVKEGYSLQRIIVKDENGKEIEVNSDGTFVMPEGKVTVSAIYKRIGNPDTVSAAYMVLGVVLLIAVGSLIVIRQNNKKND